MIVLHRTEKSRRTNKRKDAAIPKRPENSEKQGEQTRGKTPQYLNCLARNGVRIFEFTPGFCHAKMSVSDDLVATCGTINLDYRSLYHHFENGCLYADCKAVMDTKRDFEETFAQCREVTEYYAEGRGAIMRLEHMLLRLAAPLM